MPSTWYKTFMAGYGVDVGSRKPEKLPPGPPMDLANMRQNGVTDLRITCSDCNHSADRNMDGFDGALLVKSFENRWPCSRCGSRRNDVRPNWGPVHIPGLENQ